MSNETTPVGPYTIEARESEPHNQNFFRVVGPHFIGGWLTNAEADYLCRHLNSAYAAGQASREQWISVDEHPVMNWRYFDVWCGYRVCNVRYDNGVYWSGDDGLTAKVTHVRELPPAPTIKTNSHEDQD